MVPNLIYLLQTLKDFVSEVVMYGVITKEHFDTFLKCEIPESVSQEMKLYIKALKESEGGFAFFTLSRYKPYWKKDSIEYSIEFICKDDKDIKHNYKNDKDNFSTVIKL